MSPSSGISISNIFIHFIIVQITINAMQIFFQRFSVILHAPLRICRHIIGKIEEHIKNVNKMSSQPFNKNKNNKETSVETRRE